MVIRENKFLIFTLLIISFIGLFLIFGTPSYQSIKIKAANDNFFKKEIVELSSSNKEIDIKECTDFQWDEFYVFPPYYPNENIFKDVGVKWTERRTYLGYLLFRDMEYEAVSEEQFLIVFKKDDKVILSKIYTTNKIPIIFKDSLNTYAPLKVNVKKSKFIVNVNDGMFILSKKGGDKEE